MSNKMQVKYEKQRKDNVKNTYNPERVRQLRETLGLRRREFGSKIGYTYQQVERMESGLTPVSDEAAEKICSEYGVSREWLSGEGNETIQQLAECGRERRERLRQMYQESGFSQREFARRTHTSVALLNDVISGRNQMTVRYARKLEERLGIGADWLLYGDEKAKEYPCSETMIKYLKSHPELRKLIWEEMETDRNEDDEKPINEPQ